MLQNKKLPIRKIVSYLNDDEAEGGGFWLPNIQRPFVWTEEQIARLFDSIMREYPISTLLVWKTREPVKHRKFIDVYRRDLRLSDFYVPESKRSKLLVLDGQQRLQSLFLGLKGKYAGRELHFDVLSGAESTAPDDVRFRFSFKEAGSAEWPWVRFRDLVFTNNKLDIQIAEEVLARAPETLNEEQSRTVQINVARARQEFVNDDNITYQELDGIDNPDAYKIDDVVEIFIRANSGGTKLGKSDLLFSLLSSSWDDADASMEDLLQTLNKSGFAFDRDFVLKACLTLLGKGARYEVAKFRDGKTKEQIISGWNGLAEAICAVRDWLASDTFIRSDKAIPSYNALIPLIYFRYHYSQRWDGARAAMRDYLLRSLVTGVFSGSPDNLIDKIVRAIDDNRDFVLTNVFEVIRGDGRSLEITPDVIFAEGYGSKAIHLFFNIWYSKTNYSPALGENGPQIDHIFPQSVLKEVRVPNPETGVRNKLKYLKADRDQIANCMLLTATENGFQGKCDECPDMWFGEGRFSSKAAHREYLELHLIPDDPSLWHVDRYEDFIDARKLLIKDRFAFMLRTDSAQSRLAQV